MRSPSERLLARLRAQGVEIPDGARIQRTYAGRCQREAGAWSWSVVNADGGDLRQRLGSQWPVGVLLGAPRLIVSRSHRDLGWDVDPEPLPLLRVSGAR
jgi:hypothetical protein